MERNDYKTIAIRPALGDIYEVLVDKNGETSQDWGLISISDGDSLYFIKNYVIQLVWLCVLFFLARQNQLFDGLAIFSVFLVTIFSEVLNFGVPSYHDQFIYTLFFLILLFAFCLLTYIKDRIKIKVVKTVLLISTGTIPLLLLLYYLNYDARIEKEIVFAILQTNLSESVEYCHDFIKVKTVCIFFASIMFVCFLVFKQKNEELKNINKPFLMIAILALGSVFVLNWSVLRTVGFLTSSYDKYKKELVAFNEIKEKRKSNKNAFVAHKEETDETHVVVIGESLNKNHMQLYGYARNTTPQLLALSNDSNFIVFKNKAFAHV